MKVKERALIIGAGSGIGEQVHRDLQGEVAICTSGSVDIRHEAAVRDFLGSFDKPFDQIVYCAGVNRLQWIHQFTMSEIVDIFAVNVFGLLNLVAEHERRWPRATGSITAIVSDAYRIPMRGSLLYGTSKTALAGAIRNMARELAPRWRVNGVAPGVVEDTPMTDYIDATVPGFRGWTPEHAREYADASVPMGRRITKPEVSEIVRQVMFGSDMLTGAIIEITGGK